MSPSRSLVGCLLLASAVSACGGGDDSVVDAAAASDDGAQLEVGPPPPFCTTKPAAATMADISGTWVARMSGAQIVTAPAVGSIYVESVFFMLYHLRQSGEVVTVEGHYCDRTEVDPPGALVPVLVPAAWAHTEKAIRRSGTFVVGAAGYPVLTLPPVIEIAGALLGSPTDPLPTQVGDARVIDEDHDANPGITVVLNGQAISGSVFVVQRQTTSVSAIAVAPDRFEGGLSFQSEQTVMASQPTNIASLYGMSKTSSNPAPCASRFAMVKVAEAQSLDGGAPDGGSPASAVTCAWVRDNEGTLFP